MRQLYDALAEGLILLDLEARDVESIFGRMLDPVVERGLLEDEHRADVEAALLEREQQISTAIGHAVAVPHAYRDYFDRQVVVFARLAHPLNLGAPDGIPTRFVFLLLGPPGTAAVHLDMLTNIARLMSDEQFRYEAGEAADAGAFLRAIERFTARTAVPTIVPELRIPEGLVYTGRLFGGLVGDVRRRLPHYLSDFREGLNTKSVASTLFLFFACLAPAVTFGGIMADKTGSAIGPVEMLVATAACGVLFALVSGQPLVILGGTGPLLVFTEMLYILCLQLEIPFLPTYAWVGLWTAAMLVMLSITDASCLMRYFTRFTDETFAALISIIYIVEAIEKLIGYFTGEEVSYSSALLSLLLALGTFYIAMNLSRFRRSRYLRPRVREFLADFGPTIALVSMTLAAVWLREVDLEKLPAPETFGTTSGRSWQVNPLAAPRWVWLAAAGPAVLATVLVYLDQNITARIINNPDNSLQKGEAYHLDLSMVGVLVGACSLFGLPWLVAATVRSLNHLRSLATVEEVVRPGGETREKIIHVRENRVTGLAIHLMIGVSLLLLPLLQTIPMAVLYGIFLYMGVVSMAGNQFFERLNLWFMDPSLYPTTHYIRRMPLSVIHKFTALQVVALAVLWVVKVSRLGILFPLFIAMLVPVRFLAGRFFAAPHLAALDAEEEPEDEETHWSR